MSARPLGPRNFGPRCGLGREMSRASLPLAHPRPLVLALLALAGACADVSPPTTLDAAAPSAVDAGAGTDATTPTDGGLAPDAEPIDAEPIDAEPTPDLGAVTDAEVLADTGASDPWAEVDRTIRARGAANAIPGLALVVVDATDRVVFSQVYGDFALDRRVAVASASKWIAGMVFGELVARGQLSLDDTTGEVLGWRDKRDITLRHLLSFTSGLQRSNPCNNNARITLETCVDRIATSTPTAQPGARFDYGSTHLAVAARMAEVRTGRSWNALFREILGDPLGLPPEVTYFTAPRQAVGTDNPLVAGGLRASVDEYRALLRVLFHRGRAGALEIGEPSWFDAMATEPYPAATIGSSPVAAVGLPFRYGLTSWLECATPATGCAVSSSPGAFGWTPWVDRARGYYAILGMELSQVEGGVVAFSVELQQALEPLIIDALGR